MKITHGGVFGTGGGCIAVIGEIDNGLWFFTDNICDGCEVVNFDVRKNCKEMKVGDEDENDLAIFWINPTDNPEYFVEVDEREINNAFHDFCVRYDSKEPKITDGYEDYKGGIWDDLCNYFDWSEYKIDEYSEPIHFKDIMMNRLNKATDEILDDIRRRLDIEERAYDSKKFEKAKETLVDAMIKVLEKK